MRQAVKNIMDTVTRESLTTGQIEIIEIPSPSHWETVGVRSLWMWFPFPSSSVFSFPEASGLDKDWVSNFSSSGFTCAIDGKSDGGPSSVRRETLITSPLSQHTVPLRNKYSDVSSGHNPSS